MKTPAPDNYLGLPEFRPPPPWVSRLLPHRRKLLAICILLLVAYGAGFIIWVLSGIRDVRGDKFIDYFYLPIFFFPVTIFMILAQVFFFSAAPQLRWPKPTRKRSIWLSIVGGSAIAGALTAGLLMALLSFFDVWGKLFKTVEVVPIFSALLLILFFWIFWGVIFGIFCLGIWLDSFHRIYRWLITGTILELLVTIPTQVIVQRRSDCVCEEGSIFAVAIGSALLLTGFGPGIFMLYMYRKMMLAASDRFCIQCGYNLFGLASRRCPECGTDF